MFSGETSSDEFCSKCIKAIQTVLLHSGNQEQSHNMDLLVNSPKPGTKAHSQKTIQDDYDTPYCEPGPSSSLFYDINGRPHIRGIGPAVVTKGNRLERHPPEKPFPALPALPPLRLQPPRPTHPAHPAHPAHPIYPIYPIHPSYQTDPRPYTHYSAVEKTAVRKGKEKEETWELVLFDYEASKKGNDRRREKRPWSASNSDITKPKKAITVKLTLRR